MVAAAQKTSTIFWFAAGGFFAVVLGIMGFNYVYDPFQFYRLHAGESPRFSQNERYQNPGLLRHLDYDTIVVGSSISQNFSPEMFAGAGWNLLNVTASGSGSYLHRLIIDAALAQGKAKRVLRELRYGNFSGGVKYVNQERALPDFLYQGTLERPFQYLLSLDLLEKSWQVASGTDDRVPLELVHAWYPQQKFKFGTLHYLREYRINCQGFDPVQEMLRTQPSQLEPGAAEALRENLEVQLQRFPDVEFIAYYPPISYLNGYGDRTVFRNRMAFRRATFELAKRYPNFQVYDFSILEDVVDKPYRFKDPLHFDLQTQRTIARELSNPDSPYRVVPERWLAEDPYPKKLAAFDVSRLAPCGGPIGSHQLEHDYQDLFRQAEAIRRSGERDPLLLRRAFRYFREAAENVGDLQMVMALGLANYYGWGGEQDLERAGEIFLDDAFDWHPAGLLYRARVLLNRSYSGYDRRAGIEALRRSANLGSVQAKQVLATVPSAAPRLGVGPRGDD